MSSIEMDNWTGKARTDKQTGQFDQGKGEHEHDMAPNYGTATFLSRSLLPPLRGPSAAELLFALVPFGV